MQKTTPVCGHKIMPKLIGVLVLSFFVLSAPAADASQAFREGIEAANAGNLERAVEKWTKAIRLNPKSYAAHINRGTAYMRTGHVFKAIMDWHKARELAPMFAYAVYGGGFIPEASRNTEILNYAESIELMPDYLPSVVMAGAMLMDFERSDQTVEMFRKCIDLTRNPLLKNYLEHWIESLTSKPGN